MNIIRILCVFPVLMVYMFEYLCLPTRKHILIVSQLIFFIHLIYYLGYLVTGQMGVFYVLLTELVNTCKATSFNDLIK